MKLNKTKVRYILRQNRKGVATEEIARDVKVSQRRVQPIIKEYKDTGQEPVVGEKVGRPRKPFIEKEAEVIRAAHARYRFGARMLETVIRKQFKICIFVISFAATMVNAGSYSRYSKFNFASNAFGLSRLILFVFVHIRNHL